MTTVLAALGEIVFICLLIAIAYLIIDRICVCIETCSIARNYLKNYIDRASKGIDDIGNAFKNFGKMSENLTKSAENFGKNIDENFKK